MTPNLNEFENRSPALVLILSIVTLGLYLIYWYYKVYDELKRATGSTPTENDFVLDFILVLVTCSLWGVYVDYRISRQLEEIMAATNQPVNETATLVVVLDVIAYPTAYITNLLSSAIQQDVMNKLARDAQPMQRTGDTPGYS